MTDIDSWVLSSRSLDAIADKAREVATADEWANLNRYEREFIVTAALPGITPDDIGPYDWTYIVQGVRTRLQAVHLCLGADRCLECQ